MIQYIFVIAEMARGETGTYQKTIKFRAGTIEEIQGYEKYRSLMQKIW